MTTIALAVFAALLAMLIAVAFVVGRPAPCLKRAPVRICGSQSRIIAGKCD